MSALALVVFDVDGTLIDSQAHIAGALEAMYEAGGRPCPDRQRLLSIVGLSLTQAIEHLEPDLTHETVAAWAEVYRARFIEIRQLGAPSPLYPGARDMLDRLRAIDHVLLGVATGKARRGLDHVIEAHGLAGYFVTLQTSDNHPSKPHPAMLEAALSEVGVAPAQAVMIGDTSFDMDMARSAGVPPIAVTWGYHSRDRLVAAEPAALVEDFDSLASVLSEMLGVAL